GRVLRAEVDCVIVELLVARIAAGRMDRARTARKRHALAARAHADFDRPAHAAPPPLRGRPERLGLGAVPSLDLVAACPAFVARGLRASFLAAALPGLPAPVSAGPLVVCGTLVGVLTFCGVGEPGAGDGLGAPGPSPVAFSSPGR